MTGNPQLVNSRWITDFEKQLMRGRHMLLYGNIHDQFIARGQYHTLQDYVRGHFASLNYDIVVSYDPVDGFSFATKEMERQFNDMARRRLEAANPGLTGDDTPDPQGQPNIDNTSEVQATADSGDLTTAPPRRSSPAASRPRGNRRVDPQTAFSRLRHVMSQGEVSVAAIVNLGDMLTSDANRYAEAERGSVIILQKAMLEAAIILEGPLAGYRNTLVLTAGELRRVPEWLYMDLPVVTLIQCGRPDKDERLQFIANFHSGFFAWEEIPADEQDELFEEFADLTDGFQAWDLEALRRTSWVEQIPILDLRSLIDYFKFGIRDDPWEELSRDKVANAQQILGSRVIGQPFAVEAVCRMLTSARVGISMSGTTGRRAKPKGVFFFVGPTGVGKTELAKAVTELVFSDERAFARFDMSEYKEEHAAEKLAGAPPGFVGYDEGGQLTNRVLEHPHSILLFDEIEKAHPRVLDKFLQILEDGRLTDGKGQTAYFNQSAIIFTSNIGASELYSEVRERGGEISFEEVQRYFQEKVRDFFANKINRAEIYNRLGDSIVPFDILRPDFVVAIGRKFISALKRNSLEKYGIKLETDDSVETTLLSEMQRNDNLLLGGRRIKTILETQLEHPFNAWIFRHTDNPASLNGVTLRLSMDAEGRLAVERG
ncbi:MAG: ATP-dependent Clp protease ATP-binding subunit [Planctomycetales bacterium]|nr:ATP-dependent Clp protease ATP-binding subunit [bacterium]UNM06925.1 MAG: ATP-dependent Clp protease ATP-binding subunit [Planctomycetales bacterium]